MFNIKTQGLSAPLVGLIFLGCVAGNAYAGTVLYSNLGDPFTTNSQLNDPLYQSFTSGTTNLSMDDLKLVLDVKAPDTGSFLVNLYGDNSTKPGALLQTIATVNDTSLTLTATAYDFSVPNYALAANTRYWIGLIPSSSIEAAWESSNPQSGDTGVSGQYADYNGLVFVVGPSTSPALQMTVDAVSSVSSTPEPSSGLLLGAGIVALCWFARRGVVVNVLK